MTTKLLRWFILLAVVPLEVVIVVALYHAYLTWRQHATRP
jgi:hypothetical protein